MSYRLTAKGETRAIRVTQTKGPEDAVISFMYDVRDPVEFDEIMDETHMDDATGRKIMERLVGTEYVKEV